MPWQQMRRNFFRIWQSHQGVSPDLYVTRSFPSHTAFLARFRHSRWLLLSLILGSFFAASCEARQRPAAAELTKVKITLQRSACEGPCPEYRVTIHGDGRVVFTTDWRVPESAIAIHHRLSIMQQGILLPGTHEERIAPETAAALFARFQKAGFFNLRSAYQVADTVDLPEFVLTVDTGQRHKSVVDYWGEKVGMPKIVTELEEAVDKAAGTDRWLRGSIGLTAWLDGQHFDFHSPEAAQLAARADEATVLDLIDRGVPLDSEVSFPKFPPDTTPVVAGISLVESAIRRGQARLFNKLIAIGWLDRLGKERAAHLFAQSAAGCSPALVDAAADAGIDIDEPEPPHPNAARYESQGKTALANVTASRCWDHPEAADRVATARRLLARGANPNHRDSLGHTPLFGVANPDMVNLLLAHGAERR
jgi:hypothetical protein